ncbi:YhcN/YlaJ family sporulation lipoprotein [Paenibacillus alvei]|uniref:YhcN/YlaJ family sporulation lipoprotein n=1 Tax=Paenibacillus alvei TaxID=44250 RepID=UPI0018CCEDBE|nr:YhcN/YlaJ family sporulation lipoprotein [Paenibacillus alvei]MBG9734599.1 hypothetical protein [Paenibacillus alvei]MBG9743090.1 hypothetical protein [Paenibacillus alvei]MCY9579617.1 YhcN/YlaJ family sporulation lipoprotein [Paenibacillus alvei]MCY9586577.1 YhcN/YlaJ family sporulation lipoprotein [Paenibacillus alvei]
MRARAFLLTMTAALVMTMGLTGCMQRDNVTTRNVRQNNINRTQDGVRPLGTDYRFNANRYNTNFQGDGLRNDFGLDGNNRGNGFFDGFQGNNYGGYGNYRNYGYNRMDGGRYGVHTANKMEMSQKIANRLASIKGVKSANVLLTNNNAYVAVVTDNKPKGAKHGGTGPRPYSAGSDRTYFGSYDGTPAMNENVSAQVKENIANLVKKEAPNCNNVYVSANPDFVNRMNEYNKQASAGNPIAGFTNEFQEMVYRLFPTNATNQNFNNPTRMNNMAPGTR